MPADEVLHPARMWCHPGRANVRGQPARRWSCRAFGIGVFFGGLVLAAAAPNYITRIWQHDDGLPQNAVSAVLQTRDGYLWIATYSGLARFDGVRFVVFDNNNTPAMYSSRVTSLYEDDAGTLWIGFETGGLTRYSDGKFTAVDIPAEWGGRRIIVIGMDTARDLWLLGVDGWLLRLRDRLMLPPAAGGNVAELGAIVRDASGTTWVLWNGMLSQLASNRLAAAPFHSEVGNGFVQGIASSRNGGLWVASDGRVREWRDGRWAQDLGPAPWGFSAALSSLIERHDGGLAAGVMEQGLDLISPEGETYFINRTNGLPSDWVRALCEDHEGNLWLGTGNGLAQLKIGKVTGVFPPDRWQGRAVLSVSAAPDGSLWVGTEGSGLYRLSREAWTRFGTEAGISNQFVWSVAANIAGGVWAGTWGGGMFVQRAEVFERQPVLDNDTIPVLALLRVSDNEAWIGTSIGLLHWSGGAIERFGANRGLVFPDVRAVVRDEDGAIWFGMLGGGLGLLKDGEVRQFRKSNGLGSDFVQCLRKDRDGNLWIGTFGGGLNRFKNGRFAAIASRQGLANDVICDIEDDGFGNFWFSSHGGIFRVSTADLNSCADGLTNEVHCVVYDKSDGLPTLECSGGFQPAGCRTEDGRLWFPTSGGLVFVDPSERKVNHFPPPVVIETMQVDGQPVAIGPDAAGPVRIEPGRAHFEFNFTALSLVAPEKVKFKYRLEGLESHWEDSGSKRFATYSVIPPGKYTLRVVACNNDGIWNGSGASLGFIVLPHFWQTGWFRFTAAALGAVGISGVVRFDTRRRMRRKLDRLEHQRAIERERARIAKDIHDDLGASLTRITLLSQSARGELENAPRASENLDRIYGIARELTRAMDEIVWAVNPEHDTLDSLVNYLGRFAQDLLAAANVRCRLDLSVQLPTWPVNAEIRHSVFLASKEALHNVVKHSGASEVHVSLTLHDTDFVLVIRDDGRGFDLSNKKPGGGGGAPDRFSRGNGLVNMRRRLSEIRGRCDIQTAPGRGTEIKFSVPVPAPRPDGG